MTLNTIGEAQQKVVDVLFVSIGFDISDHGRSCRAQNVISGVLEIISGKRYEGERSGFNIQPRKLHSCCVAYMSRSSHFDLTRTLGRTIHFNEFIDRTGQEEPCAWTDVAFAVRFGERRDGVARDAEHVEEAGGATMPEPLPRKTLLGREAKKVLVVEFDKPHLTVSTSA